MASKLNKLRKMREKTMSNCYYCGKTVKEKSNLKVKLYNETIKFCNANCLTKHYQRARRKL